MVEADRILKYAEEKGAQEAEVISENSAFKYVKFELGEPKQVFLGKSTEYAVRVVIDRCAGFTYFTGNWRDAVAEAVSLARSGEKDDRWRSFGPDRPVTPLNLYRKEVEDVSIEQLISDMELVCEAAEDEKIIASNIDSQMGYSTVEVSNSSGTSKKDKGSITHLRVMCRAADSDYGMGYAHAHSLGYDINFSEVGEQAREKALAQLGKEKTESGKKKVIFAPKVFSSLLVNAVMPSFLGHNVVEGRSALRIGQEIASDYLEILENPLLEATQGRSFDDEGTPSRVVALVDRKCVQNFLYDNYYGETTGSGIRYVRYSGRNLRDPPRPCGTSLTVRGESVPLDELISGVGDGLLVVEETNSHASKPQSGLFSIGVTSGFIIRNGEISSPVKRCMISGLAFEDLLPHVTLVSRERELHRSFVFPTYVETGHILVDSLQVTA